MGVFMYFTTSMDQKSRLFDAGLCYSIAHTEGKGDFSLDPDKASDFRLCVRFDLYKQTCYTNVVSA